MNREQELKRLLELKKKSPEKRNFHEQQKLNELNKKYGTSEVKAKELEAILQKDPSLKKGISAYLKPAMTPVPSSAPIPKPQRHLKKSKEPEPEPEAPKPRFRPTPFD